jgi:hypothetical protein
VPLHWQPVGPEPVAVYWRRRALVALAALVVLVVALLPLRGGDDDVLTGPQGSTTPTAEPSPEASASPSASPEAPALCPDDVLAVLATADAATYPVGGTARLELTVRNTGSAPCRRALGQGAVELFVTSGEDRIWSSDDCAPGGPEGEVLLEPGGTQTARASWSTVRSAPDCPPDQPQAEPGTYVVTARVGELRAPGATFTVAG